MVFKRKIAPKTRALTICLRQREKLSYGDIAKICKISKSSARRCVLEDEITKNKKDRIKKIAGRPCILTKRDIRCLIRSIPSMQQEDVNFTVKRLTEHNGFDFKYASYRTYVRCLNKNGYKFLQTRKKGLLSAKDKTLRIRFAKRMKLIFKEKSDFWSKDIAFYLDGVSFIYKRNPLGEAMRPRARVWRKLNEGLKVTAKGSKDLAGGKRLHLIVVISHSAGVVFVEDYEKMNGQYFASFIRRNFDECFSRSMKGPTRLFVMDNDPSQNSILAKSELIKQNAELWVIPPRSPDINAIENVFHLVKKRLMSDAITYNITKESFLEFKERVVQTLLSFDKELINNTIDSLPRRMDAIIKGKGCRTKY